MLNAAREDVDDLERGQRVIEVILAGLEAPPASGPPQRCTKQPRVSDHVGGGKLPADFRTGRTLTNCDELLRLAVAAVGLLKLLPAKPYDDCGRGTDQQDQDGDNRKEFTHGHRDSPAG